MSDFENRLEKDYFDSEIEKKENEITSLIDEMNTYIVCMFDHIHNFNIIRYCSGQINSYTQKIDRERDSMDFINQSRTARDVNKLIEKNKKLGIDENSKRIKLIG